MTGITFLKDQILSRSSKKWFDITPVAGTRKARKFLTGLFCVLGALLALRTASRPRFRLF